MEEPKTYYIKTIKDLFNTVTDENIGRLCEDLILSLYLHCELKKQMPNLDMTHESFDWKDDGISQAAVELKIKSDNENTDVSNNADEKLNPTKVTFYAKFDDEKPENV